MTLIYLNVVQRWYSGMFGVETLSWWDSHSAVEIWKNNKNMLKQKYRMHNLYVQVSCFFSEHMIILNSVEGTQRQASYLERERWLETGLPIFRQRYSKATIPNSQ